MNYRANHQTQKRLIAQSQLKFTKVNIKSVFVVGIIAQKLVKIKCIMIYVTDVLRMSQVRAKIGCLHSDRSSKNSQCWAWLKVIPHIYWKWTTVSKIFYYWSYTWSTGHDCVQYYRGAYLFRSSCQAVRWIQCWVHHIARWRENQHYQEAHTWWLQPSQQKILDHSRYLRYSHQ